MKFQHFPVVLATVAALLLPGCQTPAAETGKFSPSQGRGDAALDSALRELPSSPDKLAESAAAHRWVVDDQGRLRLNIRFQGTLSSNDESQLRQTGFSIERIAPNRTRAEGWQSAGHIAELAALPYVRFVSPVRRPLGH